MPVCCWTSWAETRLRPSECDHALSGYVRWHSHARRRYHIGRHVGNLQVTNTYEGTFVRASSASFRLSALLNYLATGYSHTHTRQGDNRCSSFYVTYCEAILRRRKVDGIHCKVHNTSTQQYINKADTKAVWGAYLTYQAFRHPYSVT